MTNRTFPSGVTVSGPQPALRIRDDAIPAAIPRAQAPDQDDFVPSRIIINLKLDLGTNLKPGDPIQFDPPVTVELPFTAAEANQARARGKNWPDVGWWNGRKWTRFTNVVSSTGSSVTVAISDWRGDPPIGVG